MNKSDFESFFSKVDFPEIKMLPLIRDITYVNFEELLNLNHLKLKDCEKYNRKMCYFYYGRKAYRLNILNDIEEQGAVTLIFNAKSINGKIFDVYPFDTGGYFKGLYTPYIRGNCICSARKFYYLGNNLNAAQGMIRLLYKYNENYISLEVVNMQSSNIPIINDYIKLIGVAFNNIKGGKPDDRAGTIELQVFNEISIDDLEAVVIPADRQNDLEVDNLRNCGVSVFTYDNSNVSTVERLHSVIKEKVIEYYKVRGYL